MRFPVVKSMRISIYHFNLVEKCDILADMRSRLALSPRLAAIAAALLLSSAAALAQGEAGPAAARVLAPTSLRQGDPLLAWISVPSEVPEPESPPEARLVDSGGRTRVSALCFAADQMLAGSGPRARLYGVLMALSPSLKPDDYTLEVLGVSARISLAQRSFAFEAIRLDEANAALEAHPSERARAEAQRLYAILDRADPSAEYAESYAFVFPVEGGRQSAGFLDERRYDLPDGSSIGSVHAGIDWAVPKGTIVRACARGRVVLVGDREVTGTTIVLEHLPGLYSLYFHLSQALVEEGEIVERGQRIALSGSTGLATGPHLHWEVRAAGEAVDPEYWLTSPLLDKTRIPAIISGL
jgi:murein DD-endopeptidase MepM/ murein hydrolase activator NlpD